MDYELDMSFVPKIPITLLETIWNIWVYSLCTMIHKFIDWIYNSLFRFQ